jgi:histidinol-phosphate aminotransferase
MSSDILNNLNPGIEDLHPYEPGRSIDEVVAEFGHSEVVKLASNENPLGASPKALAILSET